MASWLQWPLGCILCGPAYSSSSMATVPQQQLSKTFFTAGLFMPLAKNLLCLYFVYSMQSKHLYPASKLFANSASHVSRAFSIFYSMPGNQCGVLIPPLLSIFSILSTTHFTHCMFFSLPLFVLSSCSRTLLNIHSRSLLTSEVLLLLYPHSDVYVAWQLSPRIFPCRFFSR